MNKKQLINKLDALFFGYGNAIQDCLKTKKCVKAKNQLDEFYEEYVKLKSQKQEKTHK